MSDEIAEKALLALSIKTRAERAEAALERVYKLHSSQSPAYCSSCKVAQPCPTMQAIYKDS